MTVVEGANDVEVYGLPTEKVGMNFATDQSESFKSGNIDCFVLEHVENERHESWTCLKDHGHRSRERVKDSGHLEKSKCYSLHDR
ncbi:hypothetical protein P8452_41709 [Trifolium repens]|nr:cyclin-L1-1 [Trifolium repens]WJX56006.1 hypothetical protein P8452_41709 [Trifolium repens]